MHRDLKLDNILIDSNRIIKLVDFGTATYIKPTNSEYTPYITTEHAAAPESKEKRYDESIDAYALASICVQSLVSLTGTEIKIFLTIFSQGNTNDALKQLLMPFYGLISGCLKTANERVDIPSLLMMIETIARNLSVKLDGKIPETCIWHLDLNRFATKPIDNVCNVQPTDIDVIEETQEQTEISNSYAPSILKLQKEEIYEAIKRDLKCANPKYQNDAHVLKFLNKVNDEAFTNYYTQMDNINKEKFKKIIWVCFELSDRLGKVYTNQTYKLAGVGVEFGNEIIKRYRNAFNV